MSSGYELTNLEPVPLDPQEWKLLFMMIAENRGDLDFRKELTPYGNELLLALRRKLAIYVVGLTAEDDPIGDDTKLMPTFCGVCHQTLIYNTEHDLDELTKRYLYGDR